MAAVAVRNGRAALLYETQDPRTAGEAAGVSLLGGGETEERCEGSRFFPVLLPSAWFSCAEVRCEDPLKVEMLGSAAVIGMTGIGASRPLPCVPAKVA